MLQVRTAVRTIHVQGAGLLFNRITHLVSIRAPFTLVKGTPSGKQTRLFIFNYPSVYSLGGARKLGSVQSLKIKNYTYFGTTGKSVLHRCINHTTPPNF